MRALCAAIVSAGALIGLGLSAIGVGTRYQSLVSVGREPAGITFVKWGQLDTPMMLIIVVLLAVLLAALATTYVGLAYHHERRHFERHGHGGARESAPSHF
jgi:hypothetical protein